jgi:hypothetical protein
MSDCPLERALCDADGALVDITKIEFEILSTDRFRWTLWRNGRRLYTQVGTPADTPALLDATLTVMDAMAGIPPGRMASKWN